MIGAVDGAGGNGLTNLLSYSPGMDAKAFVPQESKANSVPELPMEALYEQLRFKMMGSSMNTDVTRGVESLSAVLSMLPSVIRNIA